jgi:phage tail-like protein
MTITGTNDTKTGQQVDPFPTFKYGIEVGGYLTEAAFTECSGLSMNTDVFEYQEGGLAEYVHKFPGQTKYSNITLKRGFATSNQLYDWYKDVETKLRTGGTVDLRQVTITLYSTVEQGKQMKWTLNRAFPVKWEGPAFKSDQAAVAIESLELAHHGISVG